MAQYKTTEDIITRALKKAGEPTNGNSSYEESLTEYLSDIQRKLVSGSTVFELDIDTTWPWARSPHPITVKILPKYNTGTLSLVNGSNAGTFSSAPAISLQGWFFRGNEEGEAYKIAYHTAGQTAFTLETEFLGATNTAFDYEAYKLDYELLPSYIYVTSANNKFQISENGTAFLTATLTAGAYTPSAFATALETALDGVATADITVTYDTTTRLFTISSAGATFQLIGERGSNPTSGMSLAGFDQKDYTGATSYTGTYPFGSLARIVEPVRFLSGEESSEYLISGSDPLTYAQNFSYRGAKEGTPTAFTKISDDHTGKITLRFNNYPKSESRIEVTVLPSPKDLQNNANSFPLLPPKYFNILEYAGVYFLLLEKEDTKAAEYLALAKAEIRAMQKHYSGEQFRTSGLFGYVAPRMGTLGAWHRRLRYGYDKGNY